MINVIGYQRAAAIILLALLLVGSFFYNYYVLRPGIMKSQAALNGHNYEVNKMTEDMDKLIKGIEQFSEHKDLFEVVKERDFFDSQDRLTTRRRLNALRREAKLLPSRYELKSLVIEESTETLETSYRIVRTDIEFQLNALEDKDIYTYLYLLNYGFPGHVTIEEIDITRDLDVTAELLKSIGNKKQRQPVVSAKVKASLRTMIADEPVVEGNGNIGGER